MKALESEVLIVGGGIVGTTTAFFLRRRGQSVRLLERGLTGQQASGVNFGGIRRQGRALAQLPLANRALTTWRHAAEWLGEDSAGRIYRSAQLVICAGAWANRLSSQFGEPVPLESRGPQMAVTEPVPYVFHSSMGVFTSVKAESVYFRQIPRGNLILGGGPHGPASIETNRARVAPLNTVRQMAQFRRLVPGLAPLHVIRTWSGVEGYLPDAEPVIGPSRAVDGLFYGFGFSGSGFQIGPGVGETLAELISTGKTAIALDKFSIGRFGANAAAKQEKAGAT